MKILRPADPDYAARLRELTAPSSLFDPAIEESARGIVDAVKARGDDALLEFTRRFDGANLSADRLKVTQAELLAASLKADEPLRSAVKIAARNIESFSRKSLRKNWSGRNSQGDRKSVV